MAELTHRVCEVCKSDKAIDQFYRDRTRLGGREYACKKCKSAYHTKWQDKTKHTKQFRERTQATHREWVARNLEKTRAHTIAWRKRTEIRADSCERCSSTERLHMHHPDYSLPDKVITLCQKCHVKIHMEIKHAD